MAGCAQKRRGGAFLQHGSIPLEMDMELLGRLLPGGAGERAADRLNGVGWLNRFAAQPLSIDTVEEVLIDLFAKGLGLEWHVSSPTPAESTLADELYRRCYGNPSWTRQGPGAAAVTNSRGLST